MDKRASRERMRPRAVAAVVLAVATAVGTTLAAASGRTIAISKTGTYASEIFDDGGAEIVAYDSATRRVFSVNASAAVVDVLDVSRPASPLKVDAIDVAESLAADPAFTGSVAGANSVAVHRGVLAVAVEANPKTDDGWAAFFRTDTLELLGWADAGALPDMITFAANGRLAVVANEGEPNSYGLPDSVDPEGSITVIRIRGRYKRLIPVQVDFTDFNGQEDDLRAAGVRIFGPGASAAQDFEPEYIAIHPDGRTAYVTLQENNAVAVVDLRSFAVTRVMPLGFKDHSLPGNGFDGSDRDGPGSAGKIQIANWPVFGMYMPDGIAAYRAADGRTYLVTANEGDTRGDWLAEEARVKDLTLDAAAFPNFAQLKDDDFIGRLTVTNTLGDPDLDGDYDQLYLFGARSFSIWDEDGGLVFDSGDQFERITAAAFPANFNSDHVANNFDTRSDNKGPEPEGVVVGKYRGRMYAFVGLERMGGIMVYDVTDPVAPAFVQYHNARDFTGSPAAGTAGDLGPEGIEFIPNGSRSPDGMARLVVGNEVSGTTTLHAIDVAR